MSLVVCPECGKEISDQAVSCPNCGFPLENLKKLKETEEKIECPYCNSTDIDGEGYCNECGMKVADNPDANIQCPYCGSYHIDENGQCRDCMKYIGQINSIQRTETFQTHKKKQGGKLKWVIIAVVVLGIIGAASGGGGDNKTSDNTTNESTTTNSERTNNESTTPKTPIQISQQEIFNGENISISISDVNEGTKNTEIGFTISSSSAKDYSVSIHTYAVNGLMAGDNLYGFGSVDVPAGKNAKLTMKINNDWLKENGITEIKTIDMIFWAYYDLMKEWDSGLVSVKTNLDDGLGYQPTGQEIYSDDVLTIWKNGTKNNEVSLTILNKSSYNASYTFENSSVNNWSYELTNYSYDYFDEHIHKKSYANIDLKVFDKFLKENNISTVENIEFDIVVDDDYWDFKGNKWKHTTDKIKIDF